MGYKVEKWINEMKRTSMQKTAALSFIKVPYSVCAVNCSLSCERRNWDCFQSENK